MASVIQSLLEQARSWSRFTAGWWYGSEDTSSVPQESKYGPHNDLLNNYLNFMSKLQKLDGIHDVMNDPLLAEQTSVEERHLIAKFLEEIKRINFQQQRRRIQAESASTSKPSVSVGDDDFDDVELLDLSPQSGSLCSPGVECEDEESGAAIISIGSIGSIVSVPDAPPMPNQVPSAPPMLDEESKQRQVPKPRVPLKKLHWDKLEGSVLANSVWEKIRRGQPFLNDEDFLEVENKFGREGKATSKFLFSREKEAPFPASASTTTSAANASSQPAATNHAAKDAQAAQAHRNSAGQRHAKVKLIGSLRAYNVEIGLSQLKMNFSSIRDAILTQHYAPTLTRCQLENLSKLLPIQEELVKLQAYGGDVEQLGVVEQFFLAVGSIPRVQQRVRLLLFQEDFPALVKDIEERSNLVSRACRDLRASHTLQILMAIVLTVGNYMNDSTSNGDAQGFRLDVLTKLSSTKSSDGQRSLLHWVVSRVQKAVARTSPSSSLLSHFDLIDELQSVHAASLVESAQLSEDVHRLRSRIREMQEELVVLEEEKRQSAQGNESKQSKEDQVRNVEPDLSSEVPELSEAWSSFVSHGLEVHRLVQDAVARAHADIQQTALYFGEAEGQMKWESLFRTFSAFLKSYQAAQADLAAERTAQRRNSKS